MKSYFKEFEKIVGNKYVLTSDSDLKAYGKDWTSEFIPNPSLIVLPESTEEVSELLKFCSEKGISVVPSGGRTGLAGAAVATHGEVVLSMGRMNKIEEIDSVGMTIKAQAGVTTQALQEAAKEAGLYFPIDLAAKGSCQIGGNIATNAGGVKLIRYGGTREQVLGIEVVLSSGEVLDLNFALRKNNTGYDLKQLFIGAEGTLGVITKTTLRLVPAPQKLSLAMLGVNDFHFISAIFQTVNFSGAHMTALEFFTKSALDIVLAHSQGARDPFNEPYPFYVLLEIEENKSVSQFEGLLESLFEKNLISDAVISQNSSQFQSFWDLRENIAECASSHGHVRHNDVSLPVKDIGSFYSEAENLLKKIDSKIETFFFGHVGDGNLHISYIEKKARPFPQFEAEVVGIEKQILNLLTKFRGSVSAEHGIGLIKKDDLLLTRTQAEVDLMRQIKYVLDPKNILNPGKIF